MPRELCTRCGTRVAQTGDQSGFTLPHPRAAEPFGPPGLTYPKRHRALSMHFPPLRPDRQAMCALLGWMRATVLYGTSTTAVPPMRRDLVRRVQALQLRGGLQLHSTQWL